MGEPISLAGTVILDPQGRILLLHRCVPGQEQWETPGGRVEQGELAEETARRETYEELGVEVEISGKLGLADFEQDGKVWKYQWFLAKIVSGEAAVREPHRHDTLRFFEWEQLRGMDSLLSPNTRNLVEAFFSDRLEF